MAQLVRALRSHRRGRRFESAHIHHEKENRKNNFLFFYFIQDGFHDIHTKRKTVFVVKDKGTLTHGYVNEGHGNTWTDFMIYTRDGRSLKNVNSLWYLKWRSTELQAKLQKGKKYSAVVYGWRIGAFSVYPNIVSAKEIKSKK